MPAYLIDASIYIFQAHFSPYVECLDEDGGELSALYGYAQFLLQFLRRQKPEVIAVAMDESLFRGFRHQLCPRYKSNRELPDENLAHQLNACTRLSRILGLPTFGSRVYEADDIIGTLARRLRNGGTDDGIVIVSRDKDLSQVLRAPGELVWDYQGNRKRDAAQIYAELGVHPGQIPDYLGLVGDAVDVIGGVPGVGPVKARELLKQFGDMDGIYANLDRVASLSLRGASRLAGLLECAREQAYLARRLATIVDDVNDLQEPFSSDPLESLRRKPVDSQALAEIMAELRMPLEVRNRLFALATKIPSPAAERL